MWLFLEVFPHAPTDEEPLRSELWGEDKDEVESISNAGSLDSLDSDHEIPPIDPPVIVPASGAAPGVCVCVCVQSGLYLGRCRGHLAPQKSFLPHHPFTMWMCINCHFLCAN